MNLKVLVAIVALCALALGGYAVLGNDFSLNQNNDSAAIGSAPNMPGLAFSQDAGSGDDSAADNGDAEGSEDDGTAAEDEGEGSAEEGTEAEGSDEESAEAEGEEEGTEGEGEEGEMTEEEDSRDAIEKFRDLDPRDITQEKKDRLVEKQTTPWDKADADNYIPETGRTDPLTILSDSVPEELRPKRGDEDDEAEFQTYRVAQVAGQAAEQFALLVQCHNVIQVGLQKTATISIGGGPRMSVSEGNQFGPTQVGQVEGVVVTASLVCEEITTNEVQFTVVAEGQGTTVRIEKPLVFVPNNSF